MIVSWNWLGRHVDLSGLDPEETARRFTVACAEIEEVTKPLPPERLAGFVVAEVKAVTPHPKADRLSLCMVAAGGPDLQVVCGAPNVKAGMRVPFATVGTRVGDLTIEVRKVRGVESSGMLCSAKETGLGEDGDGVLDLGDAVPGTPLAAIFCNGGPTWTLDNKAVTHRPDLWGHYGLARELAALLERQLKPLDVEAVPKSGPDDGFEVRVEAEDGCRRYCGLSLGGVVVAPSPSWAQALLREAGLRPINNVVDATNLVMLELGEPCHAFDVRRLPARSVAVRAAKAGQRFRPLTGGEVGLSGDDLVIASGGVPVALAGVVGGDNSAIAADTTEVFLEAACFEPVRVRKTALRLDLRTDSSARFEKSLDPELAPLAIGRIVKILRETCPGLEVRSRLLDSYPRPFAARTIRLATQLARRKFGVDIPDDAQRAILVRLGFGVQGGADSWDVTVPSWRNTKDIETAIDLVEEIGRLHGLDRILPMSPALDVRAAPANPAYERERASRDFLVCRGYDEVMTHSLGGPEALALSGHTTEQAVELVNPLGREQAWLRASLLHHAIEAWSLNARNLRAFACFELGRVFRKQADSPLADERDDLLLARYAATDGPEPVQRLAADVLALLGHLGVAGASLRGAADHPSLHPARQATVIVGGTEIGRVGELHPTLALEAGIKGRLAFALLPALQSWQETRVVKAAPLPRFPAVPFSLSLIVPERTEAGSVLAVLAGVSPDLVHDLRLEGVYRGSPIPEGKVSQTFAMEFRHAERTMAGEEITALQEKIVAAAEAAGFAIRRK